MSKPNQPCPGAERFDPGVYMVTGINGIGKSTIVDAISGDHAEVVPLHASHELRLLFDGVSREELERLDPLEKLSRMAIHFTSIFEEVLDDDRAVVMDTHLLVPIRNDEGLVYENIWSDAYAPYVKSMVMLAADPHDVRSWRLEDEAATGRRRSIDIESIAADQTANLDSFHALVGKGVLPGHAQVIQNVQGDIVQVRSAVENAFLATPARLV